LFRISGVRRSPGRGWRLRKYKPESHGGVALNLLSIAIRASRGRARSRQGREEATALDARPRLAPRPAHGVEANEVAGAVQVPVSACFSPMVAAASAAVHAASSRCMGHDGELHAALELLARWTGTGNSKMPIFFDKLQDVDFECP
jgi:hypothetical protein